MNPAGGFECLQIHPILCALPSPLIDILSMHARHNWPFRFSLTVAAAGLARAVMWEACSNTWSATGCLTRPARTTRPRTTSSATPRVSARRARLGQVLEPTQTQNQPSTSSNTRRHNRNTQRFCMATEPAPPLAIGGPGSPGGKCTAIDSPQLWTVGTGPQLPGMQPVYVHALLHPRADPYAPCLPPSPLVSRLWIRAVWPCPHGRGRRQGTRPQLNETYRVRPCL